eukprot:RCo042596
MTSLAASSSSPKKRTMVAISGEAAEPTSATPTDPGTSSSSSSLGLPAPAAKEDPFQDLTVAFQGKLSKTLAELEKAVKENGGKVAKKITKTTSILVTNDVEAAGGSGKVKEADALKLPIVKEEWLWKSVEAKQKLSSVEMQEFCLKNAPKLSAQEKEQQQRMERKRKAAEVADRATKSGPADASSAGISSPLKSTPGDEPRVKKLKLKDGARAAVEPDSKLEDEAHVLDVADNEIYSVTLNSADVTTGRNSYYILQLLEADSKKTYWVFRKWGRVGTSTIGGTKLEKFSSLGAAKEEFSALYLDKTGNQWVHRNNFVKKPGKMMQIEIDYTSKTKGDDTATSGNYQGSLPKPVQDLINLLFDIKALKAALMELEVDTEKMPLGKLSARTIKDGYSALTAIQNLLQQSPPPSNLQSLLVSETNRFYNIIPHAFGEGKKPGVIDTEDKLKEKIKMMDALMELEVTTSVISSAASSSPAQEHPIDTNYKKLKCELVPVPRDAEEFKLVSDYVANTHGHTHTMYTLELQDLFRLDREGEEDRWKSHSGNANRKLLWHGSRLTNWAGIISQGLRIAPPEAPSTGYMFGKGVYFADMVTKSSNYCFTTSEATTGLMALNEVALGEMYKLTSAKYMDKPPAGYHSTMGQGQYHPDPSGEKKLPSGVVVPCGKGTTSGVKTSLMYNEFIVYDVAQVRMRYLLRLNFVYKHKAGTFF